MPRKTKDEAEKTKQAILKAAQTLFYTHGVVRTSLQQIAEEAGVTRGAVYWHFKDKVDLLWTLADALFLPHEDLLDRLASEQSDDPLELLLAEASASMNAIFNDPHHRKIFTILTQRCEYIEEMDTLIKRNHACRDRLLDRLVEVFRMARDKGRLSPAWEPEIAAVTVHSLFYGFVHMEMEWPRPSRKRDQMRNAVLASFFSTLRGRA